ncbi:hypothetical protein HYH03_000346 [Edaphochlamys debaryana]|uniref:Sphingomyelin synthase-like domain-containing protein n=1 Tax=Edaphochlamys debaryana TaxID=47281 RepID=A0A835YIH9_9CHLO|nr:hypothetical protein HYH03_000346 [Edaphochlamys debaryana]|eukprot:KAG2501848.1 hypothetical protein HYH03_000346 [Edaphochlamys debaryana]
MASVVLNLDGRMIEGRGGGVRRRAAHQPADARDEVFGDWEGAHGHPSAKGRQADKEHRLAVRRRCGLRLDLAGALLLLLQPGLELLTPSFLPNLPAYSIEAASAVGLVLLLWRILCFRRWRDEEAQVPRFLLCFVAMLAELTVENCVVWLVSAWDLRKEHDIPGLQDNVGIAAKWLAARSDWARLFVGARAVDTLRFLVLLLALAFSVLWEQVPYSGFGIMARAVLTICCSRILRMCCFMSTVLPNPRPGCYAKRFPPVPEGLWATIRAGYTTIRGFGGCNDLIFSGHAAFWMLAPLAWRTYYPGHRLTTWLLWLALFHACINDVVTLQHYSVDMLLAVVVTWAVWDWLQWVYPPAETVLPKRPPGQARDKLNPAVLALIIGCLLVAGIIVIAGKA